MSDAKQRMAAIQKQLNKLNQMMAAAENASSLSVVPASKRNSVLNDDLAVILQEDSADGSSSEGGNSSTLPLCGCAKNGTMLQQLLLEVRRIHQILEIVEEQSARSVCETPMSRADRLARADAALSTLALSEAAPAQAPAPAPAPAQAPAPAPFTITETTTTAAAIGQQPAAMPAGSGPGPATFEEAARSVSENDIATLRSMLNDTWREKTKNLYSAERLAAEPTEPPSAMDVFRDETAELAQDERGEVTTKQEFLERLRLILKRTAPGIIASLPENPAVAQQMRQWWGPEWIS